MQRFLVWIAAALMFLGIEAAYAQPLLTQLKTELVSVWLVTVDGQDRTRTLKISGVEQKDTGIFSLDAVYGWTNGNQAAVRAEIDQTGQERMLLLTTQTGSKITATQKPDGTFVGTFINPSGQTKGLTFKKLSETELQGAKSGISASAAIAKPTADVPASCAAFSGKWTGTWGYGVGQQWLWVASVDTGCIAKIAYLGSSTTPSRYEMVEIKDGVLEWLCNKSTSGTCAITRHSDDLWASYSNPSGGTNSAVFTKIE